MFRRTDPQRSLLESEFLMPAPKRALLEKSWAHFFQVEVLPLIDEELYRDEFHPTMGRPNQSIRLLTGLHILKEWNDLTDEQTLEQLEFNLQWHYALGITAEAAHLPRKTLHNYRVRTMKSQRARAMFERVTDRLMEADGLSPGLQRLDSSHIMSNMARLTRLGLMVETLTKFLRELERTSPEKLADLGAVFRKRYLDREGYFSDVKKGQARRRLPVVARDLDELVRRFAGDDAVCSLKSYLLAVRVFGEQCEVIQTDDDDNADQDGPDEDSSDLGDSKIRLKAGKEITSQSLQSPHDPDATYGHKGKGYEVQVAETCVDENPYDVITYIEVHGAHESDQHATSKTIAALQARGIAPNELFADTNYSSGENIVDAAVNGVDLQAPVQDPNAPAKRDAFINPAVPAPATAASPPTPAPSAAVAPAPATVPLDETDTDKPALGLGDFQFDKIFSEVLACPAGNAPVANDVDELRREPYAATFDGGTCRDCPMRDRCPARQLARSDDPILRWRDVKAATATRQKDQRGATFRENYKARSGIEPTIGELKGPHGADDIRVRSRARVELVMFFKAIAVNAKRKCQHSMAILEARSPIAVPIPG